MSDQQPMRVAMVGLGTVGSGVIKILFEQAERITRRAGRPIVVESVVVRDPTKVRSVNLADDLIDTSLDVIEHPDVDVVCELIGGTTTAGDIVRQALQAGKHVVTANKALLCEQGDELFQLAREQKRAIGFEAAVAGGVPIIEAVSQSLSANQITSLEGILNGTSNFILTEMLDRNVSYEDAVANAQKKGYAEADPAMDVDGTDAAQKLTLLAQLAFGTKADLKQFPRQGIDKLDLADLKYADTLGYRIKLLAVARLTGGSLELHTQPTLIRKYQPMADVDDAYNMIELEGDAVGKTWFAGMGAGQMPTASSVVSDLIDLAVGRSQKTFPLLDLWQSQKPLPILPADEIKRRYYLRFHAVDEPGTMAAVANILGENGVSIASCIQHESESSVKTSPKEPKIVPLVLMTHICSEGQMKAADRALLECSRIKKNFLRLPIRD
ncbi:homoserine dehydrogenase [uncultured Rubinisphaera sp.]|uniref:homoserine dehydrogenase n=1 Tax=uncultured Rubinisphaera sp. TaxID=1678686 RepID=UPI0030D88BE1